MALVSIDNDELLMNGSEQDLFPSEVGLKHYATKIFFDELVAGDEILVRIYSLDKFAAVEKRYRTTHVEGVQQDPELELNWIPSESYRVTCEQITQGAGGFKTITWELLSS